MHWVQTGIRKEIEIFSQKQQKRIHLNKSSKKEQEILTSVKKKLMGKNCNKLSVILPNKTRIFFKTCFKTTGVL